MKWLWNTLRGSNIMKRYQNKPDQPALLAAFCLLPRSCFSPAWAASQINSFPTHAVKKSWSLIPCNCWELDWQRCFARKLQTLLALQLQCLNSCCCFSCWSVSSSNCKRSLSVVSPQDKFNEAHWSFRITKPQSYFFFCKKQKQRSVEVKHLILT